MRLVSTPSPGVASASELAQAAARGRMREVQAALVALPERVAEEFLDCDRFNLLRNHRSFRWYLDSVVTPEGVSPPLLLDQRWAELRVATTFIWGEKNVFESVDKGRAAAARVPVSRFELIPAARR